MISVPWWISFQGLDCETACRKTERQNWVNVMPAALAARHNASCSLGGTRTNTHLIEASGRGLPDWANPGDADIRAITTPRKESGVGQPARPRERQSTCASR